MHTTPSVWKGHNKFVTWLANEVKTDKTIDVGIYLGYSTMVFASVKSGVVFGIDNFVESKTQFDDAISILEKSGLYNICIIKSDSATAAREWDEGKADIIHIDASHKYEDVILDVKLWSNWLTDNGVMLMHDVTNQAFDGPIRAFNEAEFEYKIIKPDTFGLGILTNNKELFEKINGKLN